MEYKFEDNKIVVKTAGDMSLKDTLCCGQSFRWREQEDGSFKGTAFGRTVTVSTKGRELIIEGADARDFEEIWKNYFDLEFDYVALKEQLSKKHPVLSEAAKFAPGIHILRQAPFEALISFIISQNNNIKRIEGIVQRLCESFGEKLPSGDYSFPTAEKLANLTEEDLMPLRAGFRNRYILDAAKKVHSGEVSLESLSKLSFEDAKKKLMTIVGVGSKVADCVLLYGLHRTEAFPMDVWMKRAMSTLFPNTEPTFFGEYAGIAQQYIFHYSRMNPQLFE
ncbi:MAG: DNA-3-methyladenine glycosylase 2 family protein [Ruminococcaceae bacterium]|nr:DNA-3-methyladenine glycosylase 2 family protein [Oscillospiraceae bacterium]